MLSPAHTPASSELNGEDRQPLIDLEFLWHLLVTCTLLSCLPVPQTVGIGCFVVAVHSFPVVQLVLTSISDPYPSRFLTLDMKLLESSELS